MNPVYRPLMPFQVKLNIIALSVWAGLSAYPAYAVEVVPPPVDISGEDSSESAPVVPLVTTPYTLDGANKAGTFGEAFLNAINQKAAVNARLNGAGVTVGIIDSVVGATAENRDALVKTQIYYNLNDTTLPENAPTTVGYDAEAVDVFTHGSAVSQTLAGKAVGGQTRGGVAPAAKLNTAVSMELGGESTFRAWDDMANAGAAIINNSWGTSNSRWWRHAYTAVELYQADAEAYLNADEATKPYTAIGRTKRVVDQGVLLTFAAGNDRSTQPSHEALRPLAEPALQKGVLVVVGLEGNTLHEGSNRCGSAKNWCLAAPFAVELSTQKTNANGQHTYEQNTLVGTSFSTPVVSGAAALVKQKYPWMQNDQLRTTLLTTATDLGKKGVDSVYGWGALNLQKAIKGPAQFAFGDFVADVQTPAGQGYQTYTFSNNISGSGGLIKRGSGQLNVQGEHTYLGNTSIERGVLNLRGSLASPNIHIQPTGQLQLSAGSRAQSVANNGWMVVNGNVRLEGDYTQGQNASLVHRIGNLIDVGGKAQLAGSILLRPQSYVSSNGNRYTLLTAGNGVSGAFAKVYTNGMLNSPEVLDTGSHNVDYVVSRRSAVAAADDLGVTNATAASVSAAANTVETTLQELDSLSNKALTNNVLASGAASLQAADDDALYASFNSLSAATYANSVAIHSIEQGKQAQLFLDSLNDVVAGDTQALLNYTHTDTRWQQSGASGKQDSNGVLAGASKNLDGLTVGAAYTHNHTGWNESFGHRAQTDSNGLIFGARYLLANQSYLKGLLGYSRFSNDVTRQLVVGEESETVRNKIHGNLWQAGMAAGKKFDLNERLSITPEVGLRYDHITHSAFSESSDTGFGWSAERLNEGVLAATGEVRAEYAFSSAVAAAAQLGFEHDFSSRSFNTNGQFVGADNARGSAGAWKIPQTRVQAGVSVKAKLSRQLSLNAGYRFSGASDYRNHALDAGLRYTF